MHLSTEAVVECLKSQDHIRSSDSRCGKDVKLFFKSFSKISCIPQTVFLSG